MNNDITVSTLNEVCLKENKSIISGPFGSNISSKFFVETGIPVIRGNNLTIGKEMFIDSGFVYITPEKANELNCYAIKDDLIFTAAGTLGQVGMIPSKTKFNKYVISNKQIRARINRNLVLPEYAYYWFSSPWIQKKLCNNNKGSTVPLLTLSEIKSLPIKYPQNLKTQEKVVKILSSIDVQIKRNNDMVQKLQVLTHSAFDYFSKHNNYENKIALNDIIVEKNKSQIQVNNIIDGSGDIPFFTSGESILYTDNSLTNGFNIFLSTGGNAKVQSYYGNVSYSTDTWCITSKNNLQYYLYGYLKHIENQMDKLYFHGTGLKHLQKPLFLKSIIEIPNNSVIQKFNLIVEPMYIQISKLTQSNVKLQRLKNKLLPLLINQQLL